jgi:hypothetical protein
MFLQLFCAFLVSQNLVKPEVVFSIQASRKGGIQIIQVTELTYQRSWKYIWKQFLDIFKGYQFW